MRALLATTREYTVVTLRRGPTYDDPSSKAIRWEHGRRNFALRAADDLAVVLPVNDGSEVTGLGVFTGDQDQVMRLMEADPGVRSGAFVYEIHPLRGFPGDRLP